MPPRGQELDFHNCPLSRPEAAMLSSACLEKKKFIDLFCGIGGMRLAFEAAACECVFSSDWDKYAQVTYSCNFGDLPKGDIRRISESDIPDHDILVGGFPCSLSRSRVCQRRTA